MNEDKSSNLEKKMMYTLSVYVSNKPGVLARIAHVFARRGFNIDSLVVSPSIEGEYSRMTITAVGDHEKLEQMILQINKLVDVIHCVEHTGDDAVVRELALIKVIASELTERTAVIQIVEHFGIKTVDLTPKSMILMITGAIGKIDAAIELLSQFKIVELVRTGSVVMARGDKET